MSGIAIQFRRGTTSNHAGFAGLLGEVTVDTTKKTLVIHDGSTLGGTPLAKEVHTHVASDISGLKYQTIQIAGSAQTAQPVINLSSLFSATNDGVNSRTTVDLASNNTSGAGTYGTATRASRVTVNAQGLVTSISEVTISGVAPAGTASGDLTGNYPGPTVASVGGQSSTNIASGVQLANAATNINTTNAIVRRDSSGNFTANLITASFIGDVTGNCSGTAATITGNLTGDVISTGMSTTLNVSGVTAGTYGDATHVPRFGVDAKGRVTSVTATSISGVSPGGGAGGDLAGNYPSPNVATVGGAAAADIGTAVTASQNATASATATTLVKRDANGSAAFTRINQSIHVVSYSATPTFDLALGMVQQITLTGDVTSSSVSNLVPGQQIIFDIIQDGSGGHSFVWPTNLFGGQTIGVGASKHNTQLFYCDGTNLYAVSGGRTDLG